jgi:small conductance mechanosensitive channel
LSGKINGFFVLLPEVSIKYIIMPTNLFAAQPDSTGTKIIENLDEKAVSTAELIKQGRFHELLDQFLTFSIDLLGKLLIVFVLFFIGKWIIRKIHKFLNNIFSKRSMDSALKGFLLNLTNVILFTSLFIVIINIVGTQTVSLAAIIGSAGLAIGLAVKDNLANFAGGVMLLFNKPFKGGDYIQAQNIEGTVKTVGILYTTLTTIDNKTVYIPNGPLSTGTITNYTTQENRRVDLLIGVDYGSDVELVKKILLDAALKHPKVLDDPAPFARMSKMNDSSIDFVLRVWVKSSDYWEVNFDLTEEIYKQLNANGLNIPFPQMTVHFADKNQMKLE